MWLLIAREPLPDAAYWPGRRWLAAVDAVAWPLALALCVVEAPVSLGIVGPVLIGAAAVLAVERLRRALLHNGRYRFTAVRWGRILVALLLIGLAVKLAQVAQ